MLEIKLGDLSDSFMSRMRADEVFQKITEVIKPKLLNSKEKNSDNFVRIILDEDKIISFSFLDEITWGISEFLTEYKKKLVFVIKSGEKSPIYKKLAKISGYRNLPVYFKATNSNKIRKVVPQSPSPLPDFQFEEKPKIGN